MDLLLESVRFGSNPAICDALSQCVMNALEGCPAAVEALLQVESCVTLLVTHLQKTVEDIRNTQSWKLSGIHSVSLIFVTCLTTAIEYPSYASEASTTLGVVKCCRAFLS